ncbi:EAL domain-containing protein [Bacillota bacterium Lsc_1132]
MIRKIIKNTSFSHSYQPLYRIKGMVELGAEFLFRAEYGNPEEIFQMAKEKNQLFELDTKSIYKALHTNFAHLARNGLAFINIYPSTIIHREFLTFIRNLLEHFPGTAQKIVFEIIETEKIADLALLKERINYLKSCGFRVAMDDVGMGWSSLSLIIELEPEFIKLDRYFSIDLATNCKKQKMIQLLLSYFQETNTNVILEGIETTMDLHTALSLDVPYCQGYLLAMPQPVS